MCLALRKLKDERTEGERERANDDEEEDLHSFTSAKLKNMLKMMEFCGRRGSHTLYNFAKNLHEHDDVYE